MFNFSNYYNSTLSMKTKYDIKIVKRLIYCFLVTLTISCQSNHRENKEVNLVDSQHKVNIEDITSDVKFSEIIDQMQLIKLETNSNCLLGEIEKVLVSNQRIYILSNNVYCFDIQGNYLFTFGSKGRGPNEYMNINDFCINNNTLYLLDVLQKKILSFSLENGKYLQSVYLAYGLDKFSIQGKYIIADRNGYFSEKFINNDRVFITDLNTPSRIIKSYFSEKRFRLNIKNTFYGYDESVFLIDPYTYSIYKIGMDGVNNYLHLNLGKNAFSDAEADYLTENSQISSDILKKKGKFWGLRNFHSTLNTHICEISKGNEPVLIIMNKDFKSYKAILCNSIKHSQEQIIPINIVAADQLNYYTIIAAEHISLVKHNLQQSENNINLSNNLIEANYNVIINTKIDDNPIIGLYKFKSIE